MVETLIDLADHGKATNPAGTATQAATRAVIVIIMEAIVVIDREAVMMDHTLGVS